ncbi:MAG: hypothetical protein IPF78_17665, partial [Flavobacteriales bacterium]|nr:hypothetical protein [Flavobacteriales bacterium]
MAEHSRIGRSNFTTSVRFKDVRSIPVLSDDADDDEEDAADPLRAAIAIYVEENRILAGPARYEQRHGRSLVLLIPLGSTTFASWAPDIQQNVQHI